MKNPLVFQAFVTEDNSLGNQRHASAEIQLSNHHQVTTFGEAWKAVITFFSVSMNSEHEWDKEKLERNETAFITPKPDSETTWERWFLRDFSVSSRNYYKFQNEHIGWLNRLLARIDKVVEKNNLKHKYGEDRLAIILEALHILGAYQIKNHDGEWRETNDLYSDLSLPPHKQDIDLSR